MNNKLSALLFVTLILCIVAPHQAYAVKGADLSTLTRQEADGVKYNECGVQKDILAILKSHGITLVRIRLFVAPDNSDAGTAMDLAYVKALSARCKNAGMQIMLALHYSDTWANSGKQTRPASWSDLNQPQLVAKIYDYTKDVCSQIKPDYVQIGNEINCGMLWPDGNCCDNNNWANLRELITAAHRGAKDGADANTIVHVSEKSATDLKYFFDTLLTGKVSFDIIGLSCYPEFHGSISDFNAINTQAKSYKKDVIICEMGDYYTTNGSAAEETQAKFITDVLAINSNAVYWEPCWVWDSPVGYKALFKPISGNWQNVEMTKGLLSFGGNPCGGI
jgi:arabinogalactan endo-1,4-beta-galactosidase